MLLFLFPVACQGGALMVRDFGGFFAEAEDRHVSQHELDAIIMKIDPHGDGIITKEEFIVWMYQKSCAVQVSGVLAVGSRRLAAKRWWSVTNPLLFAATVVDAGADVIVVDVVVCTISRLSPTCLRLINGCTVTGLLC
jgi:hypothetical protein